jgi:ATP-dependent DNA ligase
MYTEYMVKINTHQTLFTRDSRGSIRAWYMETKGDSYRTVSGILDVPSSYVTSEWTVCKGKNIGRANETTANEQALKEVESRYTKQLKTGYFENVDGVDVAQYVEPMLAKSYEDYRGKLDFSPNKWILNIKYNGLRMIATKDGLFTRKGERFVSVPHIENALKPFFQQYPDAVLDGECFNEQYRQELNEIVKLARKTKKITKTDLSESERLIRFYVYDGYGFTDRLGEDSAYYKRKAWIDHNVAGKYEHVVKVPQWFINDEAHMMELYNDIVADGHEGAILRFASMPYEHKRSKNLLKVKPLEDAEFIITNIQEGSGNWSGKAKIISVRDSKGKEFDATFKGTMEDAGFFLSVKKQWIGKEVTIQFNGYTGLGTPQFAQFNYKNSIKGDR